MALQTIRVAGGNLFQIAAQYLGDASQWNRIAELNGLVDPFLSGPTTLLIPARDANAGGGVLLTAPPYTPFVAPTPITPVTATPTPIQTGPTPGVTPSPVPVPVPVPVPTPTPTPPSPTPTPTPTPTPPSPTPTPPAPTPTPPSPTPAPFVNPNLVVSTDMTTWNKIGNVGVTLDPQATSDGKPIYDVSFVNARNGIAVGQVFTAGNTYTVSVEAIGSTPFSFNIWDGSSPNDGKDQFSQVFTPTAAAAVYAWTFTAVNSTLAGTAFSFAILCNNTSGTASGTNRYDKVKVEVGSTATPYVDPVGAPTPTPVPTPTPTPTGSGGISYMVGYKAEAGTGSPRTIQAWLGRPLDIVGNTITTTNFMQGPYADNGGKFSYVQNMSFPLLSVFGESNNLTDMAVAAGGGYDAVYTSMAQAMAAFANPTANCRIGWEFNAGGYKWSVGAPGAINATTANYVAAFRRAAIQVKKYNPNCLIEWAVNWGSSDPTSILAYWPGAYNAVSNPGGVDVVSVDMYQANITQFWNSNVQSPFSLALTSGGGINLNWAVGFAQQQGVKFAMSEYGPGKSGTSLGGGSGTGINDGAWATAMFAWLNSLPPGLLLWQIWSNDPPADDIETAGVDPAEQQAWISAYANTFFNGTWWKGVATPQPTPTPTPSPTPVSTESAEGTTITPGAGTITDASAAAWTVTGGGQVAKNGVVFPETNNVTKGYYHNHAFYQFENVGNNWYLWTGSAWQLTSDPTVTPTPAGSGFLATNKLVWGVNGHRDTGAGLYGTTTMAQEIADMQTLLGTVPNSITFRGVPAGYVNFAADVAALQAAHIIPQVMIGAFPNLGTDQTSAFNNGHADATAAVNAAPSVKLYEIGNEWDIWSNTDAHAGTGLLASDWNTQAKFPQMLGYIAGAISAIRSLNPTAQVMSGCYAGWVGIGLPLALGTALINYNNTGQDLRWDATIVHWYQDTAAGGNGMGTDLSNFDGGQNVYTILKPVGRPIYVSEFGSAINASTAAQGGSFVTAIMDNLRAHAATTATETGVWGGNFYQLYNPPGDYPSWAFDSPGNLNAEGQAVKTWITSHGNPTITGTTPTPAPSPTPAPAGTIGTNLVVSKDMTTWITEGTTVALDASPDSDGNPTYDVTFNGGRAGTYPPQTFTAGQTYTLSVYCSGTCPFSFNIWDGSSPNDGSDQFSPDFTPSATRTRFTWTFVASNTTIAGSQGGFGIFANNRNPSGTNTGTNKFDEMKIETGSAATAYQAPAPSPSPSIGVQPQAVAGGGWTAAVNMTFGSARTGATVTNRTDLCTFVNFYDNFGTVNNGNNYCADSMAPPECPNPGPAAVYSASRPLHVITASTMQAFILPKDPTATTITSPTSNKSEVNQVACGSYTMKYSNNGQGAGVNWGQDLCRETRLRFLGPLPYFWFATWFVGETWNNGAEIDLPESFGYDNGGGATNFDFHEFHANSVGGTDARSGSGAWSAMNPPGDNIDSSQWMTFTSTYLHDDTWSIWFSGTNKSGSTVSGFLSNNGTMQWKVGGNGGSPNLAKIFSITDIGWGHRGIATVRPTTPTWPTSNFTGKGWEFDYDRVFTRNPNAPAPSPSTAPPFVTITDTQFGATTVAADNHAAIQAALDFGAANGRNVLVPAGNFSYFGTLSVNGIRFYGTGDSSVLVPTDVNNQAVTLIGNGSAVAFLRINGKTTSALTTSACCAIWANGATNFTIERNHIVGAANAGIITTNTASFGTIQFNTVESTLGKGITHTTGSHDITTQNNRVLNAGDDGIGIVSASTSPICSNIAVQNNAVLANVHGRNIAIVGGQGCTIQANHIEGGAAALAGVYVSSEPTFGNLGISAVTVSSNTLINCGGGGQGAIQVYNSTAGSQVVTGVSIAGNQIETPISSGIVLAGPGSVSCSITGNNVYSGTQAILNNSNGATVTTNANNVLSPVASYPGPLIPAGGGFGA